MPTISSERRRLLLGFALLVIALAIMVAFTPARLPVGTAASETPFVARAERFESGAGCRGWLTETVAGVTGVLAARGPYEVAPGDVRAHRVRAVPAGHEITEWRCLGPALSERSWTQVAGGGEIAPFTMDDLDSMKY